MFHSWACQVVGFCSCSGLNGLVVVRWKPSAPAATSSGGSAGSSAAPCRREAVAEQRQHHAAEREAHHDDGDHPVAIFRPFADGEIAGQRGLVAHRGQRDQEQRQQVQGQIRRRMKLLSSALKRAASSTNSAWPASRKRATSVFGRLRCRLAACANQTGPDDVQHRLVGGIHRVAPIAARLGVGQQRAAGRFRRVQRGLGQPVQIGRTRLDGGTSPARSAASAPAWGGGGP